MSNLSLVRRQFADGNHLPAQVLDPPVFESWQRCAASGLPMDGSIEYGFLSDDALKDTLLYQRPLLDSAGPHLDALYQALGSAGWSVLLTDRQCHALRVYPSKNVAEPRIAQAFRQGAVLSEELIGTSAMSCALSAGRLVSVYGDEHYKTMHRGFNCAAVPVYDPLGQVCASVDITNEAALRDGAAYYLLEACARAIQLELIQSIPDAIVIQLALGVSGDGLVLAFAYDQTLIGASRLAQRFFKLDLQQRLVRFEQLFDTPFASLFEQGLLQETPLALSLVGGITLHGRVLAGEGAASRPRRSAAARSVSVASPPARSAPATPAAPCLGDARTERALHSSLRAVARLPILLLGESGVGKEVAAQYLHGASPAAQGELVSLNCAAIPEALIESELFGYEKGAFTGASREGRVGKVQQANGGTLFLDEIGDMPLALQTRLLRVLETREVVRVGGSRVEKVGFQLICATHRDLPAAVQAGTFREDLYYRIQGFEVRLPPLRQREDVAGLAQHLMQQLSAGQRQLSPEALSWIRRYSWPGNVRELRTALIYADTLAEPGQAIEPADLPESVRRGATAPCLEAPAGALQAACDELIQEAIAHCEGNMTQAARQLGISRATLYRRLAKRRQRP